MIITTKLLLPLILCHVLASGHKLAVYWGQDPAGGLKLILEKKLDYYCANYKYDIIPVAFLDIFFDYNNKDHYPGINLANHCNKTFKGYPDLLNCTDIGKQIKNCQTLGKKVLISLGGAAGSYGFTSSAQAVTFANTIWRLFLDGESTVRPFYDAVLDGVDLDIEGGTTMYYADFIRSIRQLMVTTNKKYIITGAPQCPFPDVIMGPGSKGHVLSDIPQEFDYLFVQFYNNYCYLGAEKQFKTSLDKWFGFAERTKQAHGKGPTIFIGLPADPRASSGSRYYQTPQQVEAVYSRIKYNSSLGGIMLWDASFDANNMIDGKPYSTNIYQFLQHDGVIESRVSICYGSLRGPFVQPVVLIVLGCCILVVGMLTFYLFKVRSKKDKLKEKVAGTWMKDKKLSEFI